MTEHAVSALMAGVSILVGLFLHYQAGLGAPALMATVALYLVLVALDELRTHGEGEPRR